MEAETDGDGYALFENVPIGTHYLITESEVFNDDNGVRFHLHGKSYKNENLDYEDIDLYATTGEDWITYGKNWEVTSHDGEDGKAHFAGIPIGVYQLEEVSVPDYSNGIANW